MNPTRKSQFVAMSDLFNDDGLYFLLGTSPAMTNDEPALDRSDRLTVRPPKHSET
jgi:hypothetical protein